MMDRISVVRNILVVPVVLSILGSVIGLGGIIGYIVNERIHDEAHRSRMILLWTVVFIICIPTAITTTIAHEMLKV